MSPLFTYNGKLLVVDGKLATNENCCCDQFEYGILTCNANFVTDDNFDVLLNGTKIGTHIGQQNNVANGSFWSTNNTITRQLLTCANCIICDNDPDLGGGIVNDELCDACANSPDIQDQLVNKNLFIPGNNTINMVNTQTNLENNYGRVWVFRFSKNPLTLNAILLSDKYEGLNGESFGPYNFII